jgi:hypothetical protein
MPTARARHVLTETDEVAQALGDAQCRWPEHRDRPVQLLLNLIREGHRAIVAEADHATSRRLAAIESTAGVLTDVYEPGYLDELRNDWPA